MATRVTLLHNPTAGLEQHSGEELLKALHKRGFETTYVDTRRDDYADILKEPADLVVAAGGDGTVGKIAKYLVGRSIPIGLLPLGTANNVASSLGITGKATDIIANWDLNRRKPFDVGVMNGPDGEHIFFESAGFGMFPRLIRQHDDDKTETGNRDEALEKVLGHEREILKNTEAHSGTLLVEGQQFSGNYLLVEIMNIKLAGPNMDLAPDADPGDGQLDVVLVREDEREKFDGYLADCMRGEGKAGQWQVRRSKEVQVEWSGSHFHVDDEVYEGNAPVSVSIRVIPKGLVFLAP